MFENLTERLGKTLRNIIGKGKINENNIEETLQEVRKALLDADVAYDVIKDFILKVKTNALGKEVPKGVEPAQFFIKIVNDELVALMGSANSALELKGEWPQVVMLAGLQGAGKTTATAKLAKHLKANKKTVMLVSTDVYRPAAIEQLAILARDADVLTAPITSSDPIEIAEQAVVQAKKHGCEVLLIDTAGRLHIDTEMMVELQHMHKAVKPVETLFVVDSMTGQDAAKTAKEFNDALPLTGVILTKVDGDARGGAALSIKTITGKPIKFMSSGEKLDALEPFYPDRIASRILGMGDVVSLVEEIQRNYDKKAAEKLEKKLKTGEFDLEDFMLQLEHMNKMGGISGIADKLPGMMGGALPANVKVKSMHDKELIHMIALVKSMTPKERRNPALLNKGSRKRRIVEGAGVNMAMFNKLLKMYEKTEKMASKFASNKSNLLKMMKNLPKGMLPENFT